MDPRERACGRPHGDVVCARHAHLDGHCVRTRRQERRLLWAHLVRLRALLFGQSRGQEGVHVPAKEWDRYDDTHGAVAITDGLSAQQGGASYKLEQEWAFPLELIDKGIAFKCKDGKASFEEDKVRILKAIDDGSQALDARSCAARDGTRRETFLEAVRNGKVRKLQLSLKGSKADTARRREVVDATAMEELSIGTLLKGSGLASIDMTDCRGLTSLPDLSGLTSLT